MRTRPETLLIAAMALFALTGLTAVYFLEQPSSAIDPAVLVDPALIGPTPADLLPATPPQSAAAWFQQIRGYCNPVDVETRLRWQPAPGNEEGWKWQAACYALAGKIDLARASIERLPPAMRYQGAGVVFEAGHPAADAGDELAAGPLMELVVEFWPNHYMALYHAGAARYERGDHEVARGYLERFLAVYQVNDGWRSNASSMLETIEG
ncbi:MAG: hypothetical protein OEN56_03170 [Gemmatimonadota bacterium]|nr:hypothetical protein [Gemmatimonadota bacterium]